MTASGIEMPQVRPILGRLIQPGEDRAGGERVAVIGYSVWQGRYGGLRDIVGTVVRANGQPYTVVGVMPEGFLWPNNSKIWLPYQVDPLATKRGDGQQLEVVARLK